MSYLIVDKMAEYTDRTTGNIQIRAQIVADTAADLPANTTALSYLLGTYAKTVDTGDEYYIDSNGSWILQPSPNQLDLTGYYTSAETDTLLSGKQDSLDSAQLDAVNSGITSALVAMIQKSPQVISRTVTTITASDTLTDTGVSYTIPASGYVRITATAQYKDSGSNPQELVIRTDSSVFAHETFTTGDNQYGLTASCIVGGIGTATLKIFSRFRLSGGGAYIILTVETIPSA